MIHLLSNALNDHQLAIKKLADQVDHPIEGFYGPDSMTWFCYRNPIMVFSGMRALILQLAHPAVARGVADHSNFKTDTYGRARRTFTAMNKLFFGDVKTALTISKGLYRMHAAIGGQVDNQSYQANEPHLLLWVLATLVEATFFAFECGGQPLSLSQKRAFYEESKTTALLMGIPMDVYPPNLEAFQDYFNKMISGNQLVINETTKEITNAIFQTPFTIPYFNRLMAAATLPRKIRDRLGLKFEQKEKFLFKVFKKIVTGLIRLTPKSLTYAPTYHLANYRIKKYKKINAGNRKPSVLERVYKSLAPKFMQL